MEGAQLIMCKEGSMSFADAFLYALVTGAARTKEKKWLQAISRFPRVVKLLPSTMLFENCTKKLALRLLNDTTERACVLDLAISRC